MINISTTIHELMQHTNYIDIELISETREEALDKIKSFRTFGEIEEKEVGPNKWFQINSDGQEINVFSYYKKDPRV